MAPSEPSHAPHQPTPVATSPAAQDTSAASNGSQEISGFEIMPASGRSLKPTSVMTAASRMPATALPTPRLMPDKHLSKKSLKSKSMANEHIDLAKIYLSMGDPGTAQMVLQQVIEEGTEAEKSIASHLMQQMV
jgi:FimV-like protein